jgi:hypothetical protein
MTLPQFIATVDEPQVFANDLKLRQGAGGKLPAQDCWGSPDSWYDLANGLAGEIVGPVLIHVFLRCGIL